MSVCVCVCVCVRLYVYVFTCETSGSILKRIYKHNRYFKNLTKNAFGRHLETNQNFKDSKVILH